jgi:hypothetical protein
LSTAGPEISARSTLDFPSKHSKVKSLVGLSIVLIFSHETTCPAGMLTAGVIGLQAVISAEIITKPRKFLNLDF